MALAEYVVEVMVVWRAAEVVIVTRPRGGKVWTIAGRYPLPPEPPGDGEPVSVSA